MKHISILLLSLFISRSCFGGPIVSIHENADGVTVRDNEFKVIGTISTPKQIAEVQRVFLNAKKIGTTKKQLINPSHKFDFSDRWLVDMSSGEFVLLTKQHTDIYQFSREDLERLKELLRVETL